VNADDVVRVTIAASSDVACAQIETLLSAETDLCVVASGAAAVLPDLLRQAKPDVLVLELGSDTAEGLAQIAERVALPATVLLSSDGRRERHQLELGVRAVLSSHTSAARLAAAIRAVAAGLVVLDEHAAGIGSPSEPEPREERERIDALTPRETEVLQLLAEGLPNKEIAGTLGISEHTVKFHLSAIFGKLGATSRTEAVTIGIRQGLVMV
jgi:two-component system, NarL family, response regulator YdfI